MGLMNRSNLFAALALVTIGLAFTACGSKDNGSTVAAVPVNQCIQPNGVYGNAGYPYGANVGYQPGYPPGYQRPYGYGNPAPFQPYNYGGTGCGATGVPTCYPNNGGLQCIPQSFYQNMGNYNPLMYGYQQQYNNYGYLGYQGFGAYGGGYGAGYGYGGGGISAGIGIGIGGIGFGFQYNLGSGGYYPNRYVQGCNVNSYLNTCGAGAICRPINYNGLGICARAY